MVKTDSRTLTRRDVLAAGAAAGAMSVAGTPAGPGRRLEAFRRDHARSEPDQGSSRRTPAASRGRVHRTHRHQGLLRTRPGAAAAPEGGDRADLRPAELRRGAYQLPCAEAAVRQGRLARRLLRLHQGPDAHRSQPDRRGFQRRRAAIRQERERRASVAAVLGRLLHPLLEQGIVREEGRCLSRNARGHGARRRDADRSEGRHVRLRRTRPAQRQHGAVGQFLPGLRRRVPRRQRQHPDRRAGGDRGDEAVSAPAHQARAARRGGLQLDGIPCGVHAGQGRDVARRRRLGAAAREPEHLAHRRQDRLFGGAEGSGRPVLGHLRRRHRRHAGEHEEGGRLSLLPVGRLEDHGRAPAAGRRRRAVPQLDPQRRDRARRREDAAAPGSTR